MNKEEFTAEFYRTINGKLNPNGSYAKVLFGRIAEPTMANAVSVLNIIEAEKSGSYAAIMVEMNRLQEASCAKA